MNAPVAVKIHALIALFAICGVSAMAQDSTAVDDSSALIRDRLETVEALRQAAEYQEGLGLAKEALREAEELGNDELITEALYQISLIYYFMESFEEARAYMEIGLTHARLHGLSALEADLLNAQGVLEWKQGNLYEASAKLMSALDIRSGQEQWISMASIANNLGIIAFSLQKYEEAVGHYKQGLDWLGDRENDRMRASLLSNLGESLIPLGNYEEAETYLQQSLEIEKRMMEPQGIAYTYFNLGELRSGQGDSEQAIELYHKALEIQTEISNDWSAALTRLKLAREHMNAGDAALAIEKLTPGYETAKQMNALTLLRDYAEEYAAIYKAIGDNGKSRYYNDLKDWFATRAEAPSVDSGNIRVEAEPTAAPETSTPKPSSEMSTVRIATLGLLIILIFILVIENMRLRKLMQKE